MGQRSTLAIRWLLSSTVLLSVGFLGGIGCSEDDSSPAALEGGGGVGGAGGGGRDSASDGASDAGGDEDTGIQADSSDGSIPGCIAVDPLSQDNVVQLTFLGIRSADVQVRSAFATWDRNRCDVPTVLIVLTEAGCEVSQGDRFEVRFEEEAVNNTIVQFGFTQINGDPDDPVAPELILQASDAKGSAVAYGNCLGASGTFEFEQIDIGLSENADNLARVNASFLLTLTDCTGFDAPVLVEGGLDVMLQQDFADVCP
ncbi:MAG: hypothetical protein AAF550_08005 [Myxococcota bacterium]